MRNDPSKQLSVLHGELEMLEAETFEIADHAQIEEEMMAGTCSSTSTTSSTSTSTSSG